VSESEEGMGGGGHLGAARAGTCPPARLHMKLHVSVMERIVMMMRVMNDVHAPLPACRQ